MKAIKTWMFTIMLCCIYQKGNTQTMNWYALKNSRHIVTAGIGWDYSISYSLGYAYQVKAKVPVLLNVNFAIPSGKNLLDDFKTKVGVQVVVLNKANLKGCIIVNGIYRRYENPLVRLQNFGSEMKGTFGYYKKSWFVAVEVGFDKAIVTHFKHSKTFRENIFQEVEDGWYEPATGGNFLFGVQTGYSYKKSDFTLNIGMVRTQNFKTTPLIPYYCMLGYNYRIK